MYPMKNKILWVILTVILIAVIFVAAFFLKGSKLPWISEEQITPYVPPLGEVLPTATFFPPSAVTPTFEPDRVWADPDLPEELLEQLAGMDFLEMADQRENAATALLIGDENPLIYWVFAAAVPFPTVTDGISGEGIRSAWQGGASPQTLNRPILMDQDTVDFLTLYWGEPEASAVEVVDPGDLARLAWSQQPSLAILPFEALTPDWKVLKVDGISPLDQDFAPGSYGLSVPISAVGFDPNIFQEITSNRDENKFTSVVLTGVTALVRATAWTMELEGINYPARDILSYLVEADILHISNEVPFAQGCPYPDPGQQGLKFCSDSRYIELMDTIGTDVVELTGDHFGDYGPEAMLYTLEIYNQRGWPYYGGGADRADAQEPVLFEHHGNKIAFLGCNAKGGGYATANIGYPGAVACDFSTMTRQIEDLREEGYLPIATFQHFEYYTYLAQQDQIRDARTLTNAGAVIVSGSQAHQPQGFEIRADAFIHHGLGNLFFDQLYEVPPHTASAFIDRHIFYNGKHISTELLTIKFEDYARARPMTAGEREVLLRTTFSASGW
jgi:poly-gamma-glutamate synthesis protein (capsule biosynthesis protein)